MAAAIVLRRPLYVIVSICVDIEIWDSIEYEDDRVGRMPSHECSVLS